MSERVAISLPLDKWQRIGAEVNAMLNYEQEDNPSEPVDPAVEELMSLVAYAQTAKLDEITGTNKHGVWTTIIDEDELSVDDEEEVGS